ncbi:hypothetical protein FNT36_19070 [Hymenobacter setariae]|uniref:TonB-dependent receptor plug domain-containing protein n=1 Tax=Hymenobacter setariae TaxID=2594794 RepID=A0A558BPA4_9BACT|nr:hypothetical protein FNT36_19070 [Hymenobacter setariae]
MPCQIFTDAAASEAWITKTQQLPLRQQVLALRQRVACDTAIRDISFEPQVCLMGVSPAGRRAYAAAQHKRDSADTRAKGFSLLYIVNGQFFTKDLAGVTAFQKLVTIQAVRKIEFLQGVGAAVIYGSRGASGVVVITTKQP